MEIKELLDEAIETEIRNLEDCPEGDEKVQAIKNLASLHSLRMKEIETEAEEEASKQKQKSDKIDRVVKIIIEGVETLVPLAFYGILFGQGLRFEESGTFTSTTFRSLLNRIRPTK